jgi:Na+/H+-translocating membrane pyrophosphatase
MLMLYGTMLVFRLHYPNADEWVLLTESLTGYGLGGSVIAMFGRVGGGIYTKAADVGADLVGKVVHGIPEDDPRNPATIADNVGDNVGDVAGMGSDLFGSFAESTCAALVIGSSIGVSGGWDAMVFPVIVSAVGIFVCLICSFIATNFRTVKVESDVEEALKLQLISTTALMIPAIYSAAIYYLPESFELHATVGSSLTASIPISKPSSSSIILDGNSLLTWYAYRVLFRQQELRHAAVRIPASSKTPVVAKYPKIVLAPTIIPTIKVINAV